MSSGGTIYAQYDYWPNGNDPTEINNGGSIYYSNNLGASDCSGVGLIAAKDEDATPVTFATQSSLSSASSELFEAKAKVRNGLYSQAGNLFIQIVQSQRMPESHTALLELSRLYARAQLPAIKSFISDFSKQTGQLRATALKMLANIHAFDGENSQALQVLDDIINANPNTPDEFNARLAKFYIYFDTRQFKTAQQTLNSIQPKNNEETIAVASAQNLLNLETGSSVAANQSLAKPDDEESETDPADKEDSLKLSTYPNPFNPETTITYRLEQRGSVTLRIYNLLGEEIRTLVDDVRAPGVHSVRWDGKDRNGVEVASGVYVSRLQVGEKVETRKMLLVR